MIYNKRSRKPGFGFELQAILIFTEHSPSTDFSLSMIYKILTDSQWQKFQAEKVFTGSPIDLQDGFIHFSGSDQALETANKHFAGQKNLMLLAVDPERFDKTLKWEVSRGGAKFPHLYDELSLDAIESATQIETGPDGSFRFPEVD